MPHQVEFIQCHDCLRMTPIRQRCPKCDPDTPAHLRDLAPIFRSFLKEFHDDLPVIRKEINGEAPCQTT